MSRKRKAKRKAWAYVKERNLSHLRFERRSAGSLPQDLLERYRQASELERGGTIVGLAQAIKEYQELVDHLHGYSGGSESATLCDLCLQGVARAVETLRGFLPATDPSYARAVAAAEELVRRRPRYPAAAITLARLLLHVGRGDEALRLAESAKPDRVELAAIRWAVLGSAYLQCGELKRAQDCLRRQLQQPIQSSEQRDNAALTLLLLGGYEEGWPAFRAPAL